jgi:predicted metal-dependent phosphoesterase TrpH
MYKKEKYIDLHTHSTQSDGSMTPDELVRHAFEQGLEAVALTDHDSVGGVRMAIEQGKNLGIEVVAGVEIGVSFTTEMHMLGYFFNENFGSLEKMLDELRVKRDQRNVKMVKKLNELGIDISLSDAEELAKGGIVGRPL